MIEYKLIETSENMLIYEYRTDWSDIFELEEGETHEPGRIVVNTDTGETEITKWADGDYIVESTPGKGYYAYGYPAAADILKRAENGEFPVSGECDEDAYLPE